MADVLRELRSSREKRLREREPLITEHAQVSKALDALGGVGKRAQQTAGGAARRTRTAKAATATTGRARQRNRRSLRSKRAVAGRRRRTSSIPSPHRQVRTGRPHCPLADASAACCNDTRQASR
jgi:hypothetical protein